MLAHPSLGHSYPDGDVSGRTDRHSLTQDQRCSSSGCSLPRAVKNNGDLHNMCQEHRERVNTKQRRYEKRRKQRVARDVSNDAVSPQMCLALDPIPTSSSQSAIGTTVNSLFSTLSRSAEAIFMNIFETKCTYAGSRCDNPRCIKINGELHRLCHEHRVRANDNQQRSRRLQQERARDQAYQACTATNTAPSDWNTDSPPNLPPSDWNTDSPPNQPEATLSSSSDEVAFDASEERTPAETTTTGDRLTVHSHRTELLGYGQPPAQFFPSQEVQCQYPGRLHETTCSKTRWTLPPFLSFAPYEGEF